MALFNAATTTKMTHVPYQGAGPAVQALVAGQVDSLFNDVTSIDPFIKAGRHEGRAPSRAYGRT